jgi:hypothetical protein
MLNNTPMATASAASAARSRHTRGVIASAACLVCIFSPLPRLERFRGNVIEALRDGKDGPGRWRTGDQSWRNEGRLQRGGSASQRCGIVESP